MLFWKLWILYHVYIGGIQKGFFGLHFLNDRLHLFIFLELHVLEFQESPLSNTGDLVSFLQDHWNSKSPEDIFKISVECFPGGQWLRDGPAMQGILVPSLIWEDPTHFRATKPVPHKYWVCTLEPKSCNYKSLGTPRTHDLQEEKPLQWEARAPQEKGSPCSLQLKKTHTQHQKPSTATNN